MGGRPRPGTGFASATRTGRTSRAAIPTFDNESVGWVLTVHAVREAVRDGMRAYRFLLGQESYKARFTTADHGLDSFVIPRTARGHVGHFATRSQAPPGPLGAARG